MANKKAASRCFLGTDFQYKKPNSHNGIRLPKPISKSSTAK
jgi:hypothetical protein